MGQDFQAAPLLVEIVICLVAIFLQVDEGLYDVEKSLVKRQCDHIPRRPGRRARALVFYNRDMAGNEVVAYGFHIAMVKRTLYR